MTTGFIICGALGHEVVDIVAKHGWDADVIGVDALVHMRPQRIAPEVKKRLDTLQAQYARLIVVFGDCGSQGMLDALLAHYPDIERIAGPHCYEMYGGNRFDEMLEEELGTFFLTDFLVRGFKGTILKGLGLDRFPQLKEDYFRNYKRLVWFSQNPTAELKEKAEKAAVFLNLPLEIHHTGYGHLEERLVAMMTHPTAQ